MKVIQKKYDLRNTSKWKEAIRSLLSELCIVKFVYFNSSTNIANIVVSADVPGNGVILMKLQSMQDYGMYITYPKSEVFTDGSGGCISFNYVIIMDMSNV